jgi:hypothetical protein
VQDPFGATAGFDAAPAAGAKAATARAARREQEATTSNEDRGISSSVVVDSGALEPAG